MAASAALYLPWWELAFRSDASPVSWLSSALLVAGSVLAIKLAADGGLPAGLGVLLSAALAVLALDEQFMLHERIKHLHLSPESAFANASSYAIAVGGVVFLAMFWRNVPAKLPRQLMACAVSIGVFALLVDVAGESVPPMLQLLEEAFEVLAEAFFVSALIEVKPARDFE